MDYYSDLKRRAKQSLGGFWTRAMIAFSAYFAINAAVTLIFQLGMTFSNVTEDTVEAYIWVLAMAVGSAIIATPIFYGYKLFLWKRASGDAPSLAVIFEMFSSAKHFFGSLLLEAVKYLIIGVPSAAMIAPSVLYSNDSAHSVQELALHADFMLILFSVIAIIGVIYAVYMYLKLFVADYIYVGEEISPLRAIGRAFRLTQGKFWSIAPLFIKFIPWLVLNITGFAQLYVSPYFETAKCHLIADLIKYEHPVANAETVEFDYMQGGDTV